MLYSTSSYMAELNYGDDMYYFKKQAAIKSGMYHSRTCNLKDRLSYIDEIYRGYLWCSSSADAAGQDTSWTKRKWSASMAESGTIVISAVGACEDCSDRLSFLYDCKYGKKDWYTERLYDAGRKWRCACIHNICITDNLSTAIIIFGITIGLIFIAHPKVRPFLIAAGILLVVAIVAISFLSATMETSSSFRLRRILVWLHPEDYASGDGYQTIQALYAIGSGGFLGRGLGNSIQKLGSVPEAQNDMIFSIVCEELGILGGMIVLLLFAYLLYRLFFIAQNASDLFGSLIVSGTFYSYCTAGYF